MAVLLLVLLTVPVLLVALVGVLLGAVLAVCAGVVLPGALFDGFSMESKLRCVMKRSLLCNAGLRLRMMPSTSVLIESPVNMYLMW